MKASIKTLTAALLFISAASTAADNPEMRFTVEAEVPDNDFYAIGTGWETTPVKMSWNESTLSLNPRTDLQMKMKNSGGGIKAYLADSPVLSEIIAGNSTINMRVAVAGQQLGVGAANAVDLYNAAQAGTEKTAALHLTSDTYTAGNRPEAGKYSGQITMVFDTIPPVGP